MKNDHGSRWALAARAGKVSVLAVVVVAAAALVLGLGAKARLKSRVPPPGRLVDIGDYRLHLDCVGQGGPTVVLEAGLNDFSLFWAPVRRALAGTTRVCAYDRAGLGWSDPGHTPRSVERMADELQLLLTAAQVPGPYLLVGHSFGGIVVRVFADRYPEQVAGIVLVDPAHPEMHRRIPGFERAARTATGSFRVLNVLQRVGLLALLSDHVPDRGLPMTEAGQYRALLAARPYFAGALAESVEFTRNLEAAGRMHLQADPRRPFTVISHGRHESLPGLTGAENALYEQTWRAMQAEIAAASERCEHVVAERSGHYVQLEQPERVAAAIRAALRSAAAW